jgi:hypothetical protein
MVPGPAAEGDPTAPAGGVESPPTPRRNPRPAPTGGPTGHSRLARWPGSRPVYSSPRTRSISRRWCRGRPGKGYRPPRRTGLGACRGPRDPNRRRLAARSDTPASSRDRACQESTARRGRGRTPGCRRPVLGDPGGSMVPGPDVRKRPPRLAGLKARRRPEGIGTCDDGGPARHSRLIPVVGPGASLARMGSESRRPWRKTAPWTRPADTGCPWSTRRPSTTSATGVLGAPLSPGPWRPARAAPTARRPSRFRRAARDRWGRGRWGSRSSGTRNVDPVSTPDL